MVRDLKHQRTIYIYVRYEKISEFENHSVAIICVVHDFQEFFTYSVKVGLFFLFNILYFYFNAIKLI